MINILSYISSDPTIRLSQLALIILGIVAIYLIAITTKDILLRTKSFWYQACCILLVTVVPIVGFFLYLLIRPARTIKQRDMYAMLQRITPAQP